MGRSRRRPQRSPLARPLGSWATIRDKLDNTHYMISIGSRVSMAVIGFYSGARVLRKGERVLATWREEARLWHIDAVGVSQILVTDDDATESSWWGNGLFSAVGVQDHIATMDNSGGGFDITKNYHAYYLFALLAVEPGATVIDARLTVTGHNANTIDNRIKIHAELALVPTSPTSEADGNSKRINDMTTAFGLWDPSEHPGTGVTFEIPVDLTAVVQEIVDQGSWASGNKIGIMLITQPDGDTSDIMQLRGPTHSSSPDPVLEVSTGVAGGQAPTEQIASTDLGDFEEI